MEIKVKKEGEKMTDDKKRKKQAVHEGTGGSHAAGVAQSGNESYEQESGVSWICQVCGLNFPSLEGYQIHFSNSHRN